MPVPIVPARLQQRPEYVLHPRRLGRRLVDRIGLSRPPSGEERVQLPWGPDLTIDPREAIGYTIRTARIFDSAVTESLFRLVDPGDVVLDIGANIGYMSSLAAVRAGPEGQVHAYEPHPQVFARLGENTRAWRSLDRLAPVSVNQVAISDRSGSAELSFSPLAAQNMGLASLEPTSEPGVEMLRVTVRTERLDELHADASIGVLKLDVEGHEAAALVGASGLLARGAVRDVIFEDHEPQPARCAALLEAAGYTLFSLDPSLCGVTLGSPEAHGATSAWPGPSYLATRDPDRARRRMGSPGWRAPGIAQTRWPGLIRPRR